MNNEKTRLKFIEDRDGSDLALNFAYRSMKIYRSAVLHSAKRGVANPHFASTNQFRRKFIESYLGFKRYIAINV